MTKSDPPDPMEEAATTRYRSLWESTATIPDVFVFLEASGELPAIERVEVVRIDQANRWRIGRPLSLKTYLKRLPDVATRLDLVRILIDGDRNGRIRAAAAGGSAPIDGESRPSRSASRGWGREPTLIEAPDPRTTLPAAPEASPSEPPPAGLASTADPTREAGASPPGSFALDELHEALTDAESKRALFDAMGFTLIRRLGTGGMGVVFEAYDQQRGEIVALKTMRKADPQGLVWFKQEFRSLSDISHVNLVSLFQLFASDEQWFFTMELVEGTDFLSHVRISHDSDEPGSRRSFDEGRLRAALIQLAEGVHYLHQRGKLHRDLKPTNVLAAEDGRVVILDFGLTADLEALERQGPTDRQIVGTAAHMSPEQTAGREAGAASDWYSVGVMLFQALTDHLPFEGSVETVMAEKQRLDAPSPDQLVGDLPADLVALCRDLLERRPEARPTGPAILDRLRGRASVEAQPVDAGRPSAIVGRSRHRRILSLAYSSMRSGRVETVFLYGKSGAGRSTLMRTFRDDLERRGEAVVLSGRCYERESVPFKALDSVIDALVRHLKGLPPQAVKPLLPPDVVHLARVFPVLRGVGGVAESADIATEPPDPHEVRLRAFAGLRTLLGRLGASHPLVLMIDDLHWGDVDSAVLVSDLLYSPDPPVLLFVASFRLEDAESSRFLQILRQTRNRVGSHVNHHDVAVEPLGLSDARELALRLLHRNDPASLAQAHLVARESGGNPLFIDELVKHIQAGTPFEAAAEPGQVDLGDVLFRRIRALPSDAGRLLDLVAVSGRPIRESLLFHAGDLVATGRVALAALRSTRLVRSKSVESSDEIDVYHDRVRETVLEHIEPERLTWCHSRLARAYESAGPADPEILAGHLRGAGETDRAASFYAAAAAKAADAFAFDHAARLYRTVLDLDAAGPDELREIQTRLGDALADAGRGGEAASVYLEAAETASAAENLDLKRRAAAQLLMSGRVVEGMMLLRTILKPLGLSLPRPPLSALLTLAWLRGRSRLRGTRFRERDESQISPEVLARIDVCWSAVAGLSVLNPIQGAIFQTAGLLLALQAGEPHRIARALAMEAAHRATAGRRSAARVESMIRIAGSLADRLDSPRERGTVAMARGASALLMGDWKRAEAAFQAAEAQFRDRCAGVAWELDTVHILSLWALFHLGRLDAVKERFTSLQHEARDRGDLYAASTLAAFFQTVILLADDAPYAVDERKQPTPGRLSVRGFTIQDVSAIRSLTHLDLYRDRTEDAWTRIEDVWPDFSRSTLPRIQMIRIQMNELRARTALAMAERCSNGEPYLRVVERHVHRLRREPSCWCEGHVHYLRAGLAACRKDAAAATHELGEAARSYGKYDMALNSCAMRMLLAEIRGGEPGREQARPIVERMKSLGIVAPGRWARMTAPGLSRVASGEIDTGF